MASTANTIAIQTPASGNKPALSSQRADMHSIFAAVVGLTSLGAPSSPSKSSPSPSEISKESVTNKASIETNEASRTQNPYISNPHITNMVTMPSPRPNSPTVAHYLKNFPLYPAAAARPSALKKSMPWSSSIRPSPAAFGTLHMPLNPHSATPFSDAAMAINHRFSVTDRMTAMTPISPPSADLAPDHTKHRTASLPPLPTPHQKTPIPSKKNFPETLFDVISLEEHSNIISWLPHGQGFVILDKQRFASMILPRCFDGAKFSSFIKRLNRWRFLRVPRGPELGAYYNQNFIRDQPELVQKMRYRMDDQFEEAKTKSEDRHEENEKLKERIEKRVERKVQKYLLNKVKAQVNDESPKLTSQDDYEKQQQQQQHVPAAKIHSPKINTTFSTDWLNRPMPLPQKPRPVAARKKNNHHAGCSSKKSVKEVATIHENMKRLENRAAMAQSSLLPTRYLNIETPNDLKERRSMEIQRELMLTRPMMSHEVANSVSRSWNLSTAGTRPTMASGSISNHSYYTPASISTAQRMRDIEHAERILQAELIRRQGNNPNREFAAFDILPPSIKHQLVRDLQSRMVSPHTQLSESPPLGRSYSPRTTVRKAPSGGRPVVMSREEEEEFARYLFLKRNVRGSQRYGDV